MDEEQAIRQLKSGNISGLETLVCLYQVRAMRTAFLITRDVALAEEAVQEAFIQIYRSIRHFDPNRPFAAWFMRSVVNAAIKAARKSTHQASDWPDWNEAWLECLPSEEKLVEQQVEAFDFERQVWEAMQTLSVRQRAAVVQRYFLDMSEKEISAELLAAPGTVKWLLHVARKNLRKLLSERIEE